jgi:ABC-type phosphate/phosphonate transport system permease subunit
LLSPSEIERFYLDSPLVSMLETSTSSSIRELGKMFKELLETVKSKLSLACRKEGAEKLRRLIETWRVQAYESSLLACMERWNSSSNSS